MKFFMRGILFLARLALICNALFLVCLVIQRMPGYKGIDFINHIIISLGWLLAPFVNLSASIGYLISRILKKEGNFPAWVAVVNLLFLVLQFFVYFIFI